MTLIEKAKQFAINAHGSQLYGEQPYVFHLQQVYNILISYGITDEAILSAAYLHDVLEDTKTSYSEIKQNFGVEIAEIVYAVTDELGRSRTERHSKTYSKTVKVSKAVTLKLADRIANVTQSLLNKGKLNMYKSEYSYFKQILNDAITNQKMWTDLERLLS